MKKTYLCLLLSAVLSVPAFGQQRGAKTGVREKASLAVVNNGRMERAGAGTKDGSPFDVLACPENAVLSGAIDETAGYTGHQSADLGRLNASEKGNTPMPTRFYQSFSDCYQTITGLRWLGYFKMWDDDEYNWSYCHDRAGIDDNGEITKPVLFQVAFYKMGANGRPGEKIYDKEISVMGKFTTVMGDQYDDNSQIYSFEVDLGETLKLESGFFSIAAVKEGEGSTCGFCMFTADNIPGYGLTEMMDVESGDSFFSGAMSGCYCLLGDGTYSAQKALKIDRVLTPKNMVSSKYEKVQVEILNAGEAIIDNAELELWLDGKYLDTEKIDAVIESGESYKYLFEQRADCSAAGKHVITIKNVTNGDEKLCAQSLDFVCEKPEAGKACTSGSDPDYVSSWDMITNVKIGDIDNSSEESSYSDFTHLKTGISLGETLPLSVETSSPWDYVAVWVDWNGNATFDDAGEFIGYVEFDDNDTALPLEISIPEGAEVTPGEKCLRIIMSAFEPTSCGMYDYGETEDYTLVVEYGENSAILATNHSDIEWMNREFEPVDLVLSNEGSSELSGTLSIRYDLPNSPNGRPLVSMSKNAPFKVKRAARKSVVKTEPASADAVQHVLRYDNGYYDAIALSNGNSATYAQYFPANMAGNLKGMTLSSVDVYLFDVASVNKVVIYEGSSQDRPDKMLVSQDFTAKPKQWNRVELDKPVVIGDKDLWVGVYMEGLSEYEYNIGIDAGSATRGFGDRVNVGGATWWSLADLGMDNNFCIRANVTGERTPAISWLSVDKQNFTLAAGQSETVTVSVNPVNLQPALYEALIEIDSNDNLKKIVKVPVYLKEVDDAGVNMNHSDAVLSVYGSGDYRTVAAEKTMNRIVLTNLNGAAVSAWEVSGESCNIALSQLQSGIYLLCVEFADGTKANVKLPVWR